MDKNVIKTYAVWARNELRDRVSKKLDQYEITVDADANVDSVRGKLLTKDEKSQRAKAIEKVKVKGVDQVIEEVAYTWFNRFSALRFMEVNNYLPTRIRVFTDENNAFKPQILTEAIHMELDGLDMEKVYDLKEMNNNDELFKYLIITQCNALSKILPGMFQKIADYTELLFPDNLLREGSVIEQMIKLIPEDNWTDQVQIIGWLYEAYNTERNELVYTGSMSKERVTKDLLPAATTIFTPDWPIRYMVENSLGRLWIEGHPSSLLKDGWKYYVADAEQEPDAKQKLNAVAKEYSRLKPEDLKVIDPCQGSGHILCVLFDILVQIYGEYGYSTHEAVSNIVKKNLWGLDIDNRASQLAYFSVMMKARQYDRRFFSRDIQPHIYAICESNNIDKGCIDYFCSGNKSLQDAIYSLVRDFNDAKEYGSILKISPVDFDILFKRLDEIKAESNPNLFSYQVTEILLPLIEIARAMTQRYHVVVTNPPYLSSARLSIKLDKYVKKEYPDVKADLSMVMYKHAVESMSEKNGFVSFITTSSWMSLSSFEKLRNYTLKRTSFSSLVDYGTELFEGKVGHNPIVSWVVRNTPIAGSFNAIRLVDFCYSRRNEKEMEFFNPANKYLVHQSSFENIPGTPIAYWAGDNIGKIFASAKKIDDIGASRSGMQTGNNNLFLRLWFEVNIESIKFDARNFDDCEEMHEKWIPQPKGGPYRKWYGNLDYVVNFAHNGRDLRNYEGTSIIKNPQYYFKEGISWSHTTSSAFSARYMPEGCIFNVEAPSFYPNNGVSLKYVLGFLNSVVLDEIFGYISQTMHYMAGDMAKIPVLTDKENLSRIENLVTQNIAIEKEDWDSFETSWEFKKHPLIPDILYNKTTCGEGIKISECFEQWKKDCNSRFEAVKRNETEINEFFISLYQMNRELNPNPDEKLISIRKAELHRDITSLISYIVGCIFGRYSLDEPGIAFAGGELDLNKYSKYIPDKDAIIPVCDDEYFDDDIVGQFTKIISLIYGENTLEENLGFIANALGGNGAPREVIRKYFLEQFFTDHCSTYSVASSGKRPIYWLFDSGKKNGFKCLVYMHRYKPDTIARIRTDYVHEQQSRYRTAIAGLERQIAEASTSERVRLNKRLSTLKDQAEETRKYEEKIHHLADQMISIDLDDGVKHNYEIFKDVLAKIK